MTLVKKFVVLHSVSCEEHVSLKKSTKSPVECEDRVATLPKMSDFTSRIIQNARRLFPKFEASIEDMKLEPNIILTTTAT